MSFKEAWDRRWEEAAEQPYELKYHYFKIELDQSLLIAAEQETKVPAVDKPLTLKQLIDARSRVRDRREIPSWTSIIDELEASSNQTDFVKVTFGGGGRYTYRIAEMPARRVQVGDLVTVQPNAMSSRPSVVRVAEINVPVPKSGVGAKAVAISPEDAKRIETALGPIR